MTPLLALEATTGHGSGFAVANLLAVLVAAWVLGRVAVKLGYPSILGELLGGIVLGPPLLGLLQADQALAVIGDLGVLLMMLYIGTEIDLRDLRRASGPGLLAAAGGFLVPFVLGYGLVVLTGGTVIAGLFVGSAVGVTSLATKSRILLDLGLLDTRIAYVLMAAALLSDTATLVVFAAIIGFVEVGGFDVAGTAQVAGEVVVFFLVSGAVGWWVLPRIAARLPERNRGHRGPALVFVLGTGLVFSWFAELAGLHAILGAFVAGMFLGGSHLGGRVTEDANELVRDVSVGFLAPVFFVTAGFQTDLGVFRTDLPLLLGVLAVAILGKIGGTALFYLPTGHGWREGLTVGAAMNGRGAVEIIVAGLGLELGLITPELFTILVFMAIFTTATVPFMLTAGVKWLRSHGQLARTEEHRRRIVIGSAGPVARALATELSTARPVTLVDANPDLCAEARQLGLTTVRGDVLDPDTLERAGIEEAGVFIALTTNTEVNVLASRLAREEFLVPKVFAALAGSLSGGLRTMSERAGAAPAFGDHVDLRMWERWLGGQQAALSVETIGTEEDAEELRGAWTRDRRGLPLVVRRGEGRFVFDAVEELEPGDEVVVLVRAIDGTPTSGVRVGATS